MSGITTRRAAVCGGALVIAIGAGAIVVPAAQASPGVLGGTTVLDPTASVPSVTPVVTGLLDPVTTSVVPTVVTSVAPTATSTASTATSTLPDLTSTLPTGTSTTLPTAPVAVPVVDGTGTGLVDVKAGGNGSGGGIGVTVGSDGSGGSVAQVQLGGSESVPLVSIGATGSSGIPGTSGTSGLDGAAGAGGSAVGTGTAGAGGLLGLDVRRSLATVYPVRDGYRDSVSFSLDGLTSSGGSEAVDGVAVLRRGTTVVKRWKLTRSDQVLSWNGLSRSKIVPGTYRLAAGARDAAHHAFTATSSVKVSAKRLVATTAKYSALAVSGTHAMAVAPRTGLGMGRVTVRVTTVATKVRGTHKLIFERAGKRIVVPIAQGTRTSRAITVPASFTRFTIRHTWKKGQVKLKSIRYVYSYQSLR